MGEIPFNAWSKEQIALGTKICTSRHGKYVNDKRVWWISPKLPLWFIKKYLWMEEGAENPEELQKVFDEIYKRPVPKDEMFYVHFGNFKEKQEQKQTKAKGPLDCPKCGNSIMNCSCLSSIYNKKLGDI